MPSILGIDLGGTKTALARYDAETWERQEHEIMSTNAARGFPKVFENIIETAQRLCAEDTIACGMGVPGLVAQPAGIIRTLPNIPGAEGFALKKELAKRLGKPVAVDNDSNCFALAEALRGAGKWHDVVASLTLGTGVGGGLVIDGKIFHGSHGYAAEFGHMLLRPGQPPFPTGDLRGDAEQFLSGSAMGRRCQEAKSPEEYLEGETCEFMHDDLYRELSWLLVNLIHTIDPSIVVIGGSAGRALKPHLRGIQKELKNWLLPETPLPEIAFAQLPDAAVLGAAMLMRYEMRQL